MVGGSKGEVSLAQLLLVSLSSVPKMGFFIGRIDQHDVILICSASWVVLFALVHLWCLLPFLLTFPGCWLQNRASA